MGLKVTLMSDTDEFRVCLFFAASSRATERTDEGHRKVDFLDRLSKDLTIHPAFVGSG